MQVQSCRFASGFTAMPWADNACDTAAPKLCCTRGIAMQAKSVCLQRDLAAVHARHLLIAHDFENALCGLFGFGQQGLRMLSRNDPAVAAVTAVDIPFGRCAQ